MPGRLINAGEQSLKQAVGVLVRSHLKSKQNKSKRKKEKENDLPKQLKMQYLVLFLKFN